MRGLHRATGVAVAVIGVAGTALIGAPSFAGESGGGIPVTTTHYADHVDAATVQGDSAVNNLDSPAPISPDADFSTPVADHAVVPPSQAADQDEADQPKSLRELVNDYASSEVPNAETDCLARAVYFESKGEPLAGQLAVAEVIINRSESGRFPKTLCGVVKQRGQFSFVHGGSLPSVPRSSAAWREAVGIAQVAIQDLADGKAPDALFFHAKRVSPSWHGLTRVATIGHHVFYK